MTARIVGEVVSGKGVGAGFTRTAWAVRLFQEEYGIDPYPGTLNLRVADPESLARWQTVSAHGRLFAAPDPSWCDARCFAAHVEQGTRHAAGVIVLPMVQDYPSDQIEIVAAVNLRHHFAAADGATLTLQVTS